MDTGMAMRSDGAYAKLNPMGRWAVILNATDETIGYIYDYNNDGKLRYAYHPNDVRSLDADVVRDIALKLERLNED